VYVLGDRSAHDAPGLLMQELRQAAVDHLATNNLGRSAFQRASEDQKAAVVGSIIQLLVPPPPPPRVLDVHSNMTSRGENRAPPDTSDNFLPFHTHRTAVAGQR
jgi:hypothetical protein